MTSSKVAWTGIIAVLWFIVTTLIGSYLNQNYNSTSQLISELYAVNAPNAYLLRYVGYIPSGLLIAIFFFYSIRFFPDVKLIIIGFLGIGVFYGLGTVICSLYPLDEVMKLEIQKPSTSEMIHELTGLLTYLITPLSMIFVGIGLNNKISKYVSLSFIILGIIAIVFVTRFLTDIHALNIGVIQRIIECCILLSITVLAFYLKGKTV